jgi:hypothetical protein
MLKFSVLKLIVIPPHPNPLPEQFIFLKKRSWLGEGAGVPSSESSSRYALIICFWIQAYQAKTPNK